MNIVLLSGGSGKRLWPLSNDIRSKQFIKIFKAPDGSYESMVQRMYRQLKAVDPDAEVTIATSRSQVSSIHNQIGTDAGISVEPGRRDTFPAIALASSYLFHKRGVKKTDPVIVCPIDPYVEDDYFRALQKLSRHVEESDTALSLMGIAPTYPSEKYGYVIPESDGEFAPVSAFKEKPDKETAESYISRGALWNAGVFGFKLEYLLGKTEELLGTSDYETLFNTYMTLDKISFDYAVGERESSIDVLRYEGIWKDLGTWNTLTESMDENIYGDGMLDGDSDGTYIINELDMPVLGMGIKNAVIAVSPEGILVSDLDSSSYIKPYVEKIGGQVRYAEKSWGEYRVIDVEEDSQTVRVTLNRGHEMNYHSHKHRDEIWNVISGEGIVIIDGRTRTVRAGDVVNIPAGALHCVHAFTTLRIMEVQLGRDIRVEDKTKFPLDKNWWIE